MTDLFKIFTVDMAEVERLAASTNEPHQHDFEELLVGIEGELEHFIDFKSETLEAPFISFVTKGKVHRVVPRPKNGKIKIWVMRFKSEFIPETTFQLYSYYHDEANMALEKDRCFNRLETICEMMDGEMQQETPDYSVIRHLLSALFTMIEAERRKFQSPEEESQSTQNITFKNFHENIGRKFSPARRC